MNKDEQVTLQTNIILDRKAKLNDDEPTSINLSILSTGFEVFSVVTSWLIA